MTAFMNPKLPVRRSARAVAVPLTKGGLVPWGMDGSARSGLGGWWRVWLAVAGWLWLAAVANAWQDDPFGAASAPGKPAAQPGRGAVAQASLPELDPKMDRGRRLILENLRLTPPRTAVELAQAVRTTLDIEQYVDAKYYLEQLAKLGEDDLQLFELCGEIGSDFFLMLHSQPDLQPLAGEYSQKVLTAADRVANDPARLQQLIAKLSEQSIVIRQHAFNQLRRVGDKGAAALLEVFLDPARGSEFGNIRAALRGYGDAAVGPLLAAVNANDMQVRYEALSALARIKQPDALNATARALYANDSPAAIRESVEQAIQQTYGRVPPRDQLLGKTYQRANDQLLGRDKSLNQAKLDLIGQTADLWRWDYQARKLVLKRVAPESVGRILALDRAADLARIDPQQRDYRQLFLLAYLDAAKRLVGPETRLQAAAVQAEVGPLTAGELDRLLHAAVDKDLIPAMAGACDLIGELGSAELLTTNTRPTCSLVRAIQAGDRHTQFAALQAIAQLDPQQPYAGSSMVLATAVFLAGFGERPQALVGHKQIPTARELALTLGDLGVAGRSVGDGKGFFHEATTDSNLRYLIVCDSLQYPDYLELVQLLRADWRTKRLPLVVMVERDDVKRAERLAAADGRTMVISLTLDRELNERLLERMRRAFEPWPLTAEQGDAQADFAVSWLLKVASDRQAYRFYNLNEHQQDLADMLYASGHSLEAIQLLGRLGSAMAQRNLLSFASENEFPMELRQEAVRAFEEAMKRNGVLLTTQEITLQYERYEASADEPGESQRILGRILDLIENYRTARGVNAPTTGPSDQ